MFLHASGTPYIIFQPHPTRKPLLSTVILIGLSLEYSEHSAKQLKGCFNEKIRKKIA